MKSRWTAAGMTLIVALLFGGLSQEALSAGEEAKWTVDDILLAESAGQFEISPDGTRAVWTRTRMDKKKGTRVSNLFLSSLREEKQIQLTRGTESSRTPRWSPDGKRISFMSTRPLPEKKGDASRSQLWLIDPEGGEPWHLTQFERGIRAYHWKDAGHIVFSAQEDPSLYERGVKKEKDTSRVVEDAEHQPPVRLFVMNIKTKKVRRITENDDWIQGMWVSPDGLWAVTTHQISLSYGYDARIRPIAFLTNLETGESRRLLEGEKLMLRGAEWEKDSNGFYFVSPLSDHPRFLNAAINIVYHYDLATGRHQRVDLQWENGLGGFGGGVTATEDGFVATLAAGVRYKLARYTRNGDAWAKQEVTGEHAGNIFGWNLGEDGQTFLYNHSKADKPTQWYRARLNGTQIENPVQLTKLNPSFEKKPIPKYEIVHWKGSLDETVDGILYYPAGYEEGKRYPLVLVIHGGPTGVDLDAWTLSISRAMPLWSQRGSFVLRVNYHGSGNYGLKWSSSICCGKYYDLEVPDIEAGVDTVIERGLVDPDKLGSTGWSNGAILTTALITTTRRYKAASAGAGDLEWISDWGNVDFGESFDHYYFGASPIDDPQLYIRKSPFFKIPEVTTPTILYTGTEDRNVPPSQSWSHFRAMQQHTKTPVKLVIFPGEPHGLRKYVHQRRKLVEDLEWFDRYLFKTYKTPNRAYKKDSPLGNALALNRANKSDGNYGALAGQTLIPEVVSYRGLEVGRFEVTRAQFAAFDSSYKVEHGRENYPATGITFAQAKAYAGWLSKQTGETYRLPGAEETKTLYGPASKGDNTLDYWAGYAPNPDDAEHLREKIGELGGATPLLREVGQFKGGGDDDLVFDLGGNAAEWCVATDGSGKLMGGSADQPANPKTGTISPGEAYRGFRILRGGPP